MVVMDLSMIGAKSCPPIPYPFSYLFTHFPASNTRNYSMIVFLELALSYDTQAYLGDPQCYAL